MDRDSKGSKDNIECLPKAQENITIQWSIYLRALEGTVLQFNVTFDPLL